MADNEKLVAEVMAQLATVMDPELNRDLVSLGMIHNLTIKKKKASFTLRLTTPACPLRDQIANAAREAVLRVEGIDEVEIDLGAAVPSDSRVSSQLSVGIKSLIAVSSGKGGVGKSTVAANLAVALQQSGACVGLMDADILGPNLPMMMGVTQMPPPTEQKMMPAEAYGVKVMSMGFLIAPEQPVIWRGPMLHGAIGQFFSDVDWGSLDYLVIDLPPGTGDVQLSLAQSVPLTGAIIVTQPQEVALGDAFRGLAMFEKMDVPIIGVVENMSGDFFGEGGGERLAEKAGVPFLGSVPLDPMVRISGDGGEPILIAAPESEAAVALRRIAEAAAARVSTLILTRTED
jgi:ATP-binding protein involved in chromosome partitioning